MPLLIADWNNFNTSISSCNNKLFYLILLHSENIALSCFLHICNIPYIFICAIHSKLFHIFLMVSFLFPISWLYFIPFFFLISWFYFILYLCHSSYLFGCHRRIEKSCVTCWCLVFATVSCAVNCCCCQTNSARTTLPVLPSGENLPVRTCHSLYSFIFDLNLICLFLPSMTSKEVLSLVLNFQHWTNDIIVMIMIIW